MNSRSIVRTTCLALVVVFLNACGFREDGAVATSLIGSFPGHGGEYLYLNRFGPGGIRCVDSAMTGPGGRFAFSFRLETTDVCRFSYALNNYFDLVLSPGDRVVAGSRSISLKGTQANRPGVSRKALAIFDSLAMSRERMLDTIIDKAVAASDFEVKNELLARSKMTEEHFRQELRGWIDSCLAGLNDPLAGLYLAGLSFNGRPLFTLKDDLAMIFGLVQDAEAMYPESGFVQFAGRQVRDYSTARLLWMENEKLNKPGNRMRPIILGGADSPVCDLRQSLGKITLVYFWKTDCLYCREMTDSLMRLYSQYHAGGFEVFSVALDDDPVKLEGYLEEHPLEWTVASDFKGGRSPLLSRFNVTGTPATYLIDSAGMIMARDPDVDKLASILEDALNEPVQ